MIEIYIVRGIKVDKYEYQVCIDQIKSLISQKKFADAMEIADTVDWRRVRSVSMLCTVSEIYKINKRYEDARDILLLAYERHPTGRDIIYALCELAIKTNDIVQAIECYKEFIAIAPNDPDSYVLLYKVYKAQEVSLEEQIDILEELKSRDYREKWGYELAYLYHLTGQETKCIAACDELVLWFGEGKYVKKALELKMQHTTLTNEQQAKLEGRSTGSIPAFDSNQKESIFGNNPQMTGPMMSQYGEYIQQTGQITGQLPEPQYMNQMSYQANMNQPIQQMNQMQQTGQIGGPIMDQYGNLVQTDGYGNIVQVMPNQVNSFGEPLQMNHLGLTQDIVLNPNEDGSFSTMDLQAQLGDQIKEVMAMNVYGTQPIYYENNQQIFDNAQRDNTSPQLFEEKFAKEMSENTELPSSNSVNEAVVHTGVIDLSNTDFPPISDSKVEVEDTTSEKSDVIVSVEKRSLSETTDIMKKLEGVIPGAVPISKESSEYERIPGTTAASGTGTAKGLSAIQGLPKDFPKNLPDDSSNIETGANGSVVNGPMKSHVTGQIPDVLPSMNDENQSDNDDKETVTESVSDTEGTIIGDAKTSDEKPVKYPYDTVTDIGYVEELPEIEQPEDVDFATDNIPTEEVEREIYKEADKEADREDIDTAADANSEDDADVENNSDEDESTSEDSSDNISSDEEEIDEQKAYETDTLPEIDEYDEQDEEEERSGNIYTRMKKDIRARREFDDTEFRFFCRYDGIEPLKAELVDALDAMSMEGSHGNIIVMGSENNDRKDIAISIVKVLKESNNVFSGKVAKIRGDALNKKNIKATLSKLENGALIVENAGELTRESMVVIANALDSEISSVLVVLEDTKENMKPLIKSTKLMRTVFDARVEISDFTNNDLVAYGRGYALEKEYTIDEFGTLALSSKLGELQTYDHKVTVDEVKEIIDTAIKHAGKKNVSNFMDVLLGKRYDDEDFVILKEKDFNF